MGHLLIASQTGVVTGVIASVGLVAAQINQRWMISAIVGLTTGVVDYFVHPGMFGTLVTEAIVTGLGAAILSYIFGTVISRVRGKPSSAD